MVGFDALVSLDTCHHRKLLLISHHHWLVKIYSSAIFRLTANWQIIILCWKGAGQLWILMGHKFRMPTFRCLVTSVSVMWLSWYCHDYIHLSSCWSHFTRTAGEWQHQLYMANDTQLERTDERDRSLHTREQMLGQVWWFGQSRGDVAEDDRRGLRDTSGSPLILKGSHCSSSAQNTYWHIWDLYPALAGKSDLDY